MLRSLPLLNIIIVFYLVVINVGLISAQISAGGATDAAVASTSDVLFKLMQEFENFKTQLGSIDEKLKRLQLTIEQRVSGDDSKCTVRDITEAIKTRKFKLAEEKLNELADKRRISNAVHDVFEGSAVNADIIFSFAKSLADIDSQFLTLSALRDEIHSSGSHDPLKLIAIVEALGRTVAKQKNNETKAKAQVVLDNAIEDVKVVSTNIFKAAMFTDKYHVNVEIGNLADAIFNFRTDVSNAVMERVVDSVFGVVAAGRIIENISSHKHIPQVITGLTAIFNRFNFAGNLNNDAMLTLTSNIRKLQLRKNYASLSQDLKDDIEKVIQQLPACARNVFFHKNVCLWNMARGQYLYAASTSISYDENRRSVYTWYPGDIKEGAVWYVERTPGDQFYFKNREHADEYLYSVGIDYNKDMRHVFTWIPGNNTDSQSVWAIELDGDFCYIKTTFYNEYLFAPAVKYDELNNYVFTWKPGTSVRNAEFKWEIRNCGQAETPKTLAG